MPPSPKEIPELLPKVREEPLGDDDSSLMTGGAKKIGKQGQYAILEETRTEARRQFNAADYRRSSWLSRPETSRVLDLLDPLPGVEPLPGGVG